MKTFILVIIVTALTASCALWERHESIARPYQYDGQDGFNYYLGYHLLKDTMQSTGESESKVTIDLLEAELKKEGICPLGYEIKKTIYSRHADPEIYGVCSKGN